MTDKEKKARIRSYVAAYNDFDIDAMVAFIHPEFAFQNIAGGGVTAEAIGADRFCELALHSKELFLSRNQKVKNYQFAGKITTIDIDYEGVLAADLPSGMKAGDRLRISGQSRFEFKDQKIYKITDIS